MSNNWEIARLGHTIEGVSCVIKNQDVEVDQ